MTAKVLCSMVSVPRYAPNDRIECGNRARYTDGAGNLLCGRHLRYAPRPIRPLEVTS